MDKEAVVHIYTMDCYSTVKKNAFESVLMRWMKLERIIQSEVSQNEKHQYSVFSSVQQVGHVRLCDPIDCSTPCILAQHQLLEFTQTHVHQVSDAVQPSNPLSSASPPAFNLYQHKGLFK